MPAFLFELFGSTNLSNTHEIPYRYEIHVCLTIRVKSFRFMRSFNLKNFENIKSSTFGNIFAQTKLVPFWNEGLTLSNGRLQRRTTVSLAVW